MNKAYLLLGGNLGDRKTNLAIAKLKIEKQCGNISRASSLYETAAWGKTDQQSFLNQAIELRTSFDAERLMTDLLKIESDMGRQREEKYGPRTIDIDILLFNDDIISSNFLTVPHPQMQNRRFVLVPLAEIAPQVIHPVLKKTITELLRDCQDQLSVRKYS